MSETSAKQRRSRGSISSSAGRRASPSVFKDYERDWLTLVGTSRFDSVRSLASFVHDGSFGKTSPTSCELTADGLLVPCSEGWRNSGMGSPTECWTLSSSESPNDAKGCLLSDVLEATTEVPQVLSLTDHNIRRMQKRLRKYSGKDNRLLAYLTQFSDGLETKPQNSDASLPRLFVHPKEARESA